jgi:hypothetical protein
MCRSVFGVASAGYDLGEHLDEVTSPWWQDGRPRALHGDVAALNVVNVVEPEKAYFAAGTLAVLGDRLDDADMQFSAALARTDRAVLSSPNQPRSRPRDIGRPCSTSPRHELRPSPGIAARWPTSSRPRKDASPAAPIPTRSDVPCLITPPPG